MQRAPHRIRTLRFQARIAGEAQAFAFREELLGELESRVLPELEAAFDSFGGQATLERLEVRLDVRTVREIGPRLGEALREELLARPGRAASAGTELPPDGSVVAPDAGLAPYLETGQLPWHVAGVEREVVVAALRRAAEQLLGPGGTDGSDGTRRRAQSPPGEHGDRVAWYFRFLQLLPESKWSETPTTALGGTSRELALMVRRSVAALSSPTSSLLLQAPRSVRLRAAAELLATAEGEADGLERYQALAALIDDLAAQPQKLEQARWLFEDYLRAGEATTRGDDLRQLLVLAVGALRSELPTLVGRAPSQKEPILAQLGFFRRLLEVLPESDWAVAAKHAVRSLSPASAADLLAAVEAIVSARSEATREARTSLVALALVTARATPTRGELQRAAVELGISSVLELAEALPDAARGLFVGSSTADSPDDVNVSSANEAQTAVAPVADKRVVPMPAPELVERVRPSAPVACPEEAVQPVDLQLLGLPDGPSRHERQGAPLVAQHAGLVLLHPYLPRFFGHTGIRGEGRELVRQELPRAAALLHFLAMGVDDPYEFELGFVKVLLGLDWAAPLLVDTGLLSERDRGEAQSLLETVVQHWSALKNTSVRGLRGTFLSRRGLLYEEDRGYRLRVEAAAFDMLLERLPWGISVVRLPWMTKAIFTEWQAH